MIHTTTTTTTTTTTVTTAADVLDAPQHIGDPHTSYPKTGKIPEEIGCLGRAGVHGTFIRSALQLCSGEQILYPAYTSIFTVIQ